MYHFTLPKSLEFASRERRRTSLHPGWGVKDNRVKLFHGTQTKELGQRAVDQVPGLYEGRLEDLDLVKLLNSQTP